MSGHLSDERWVAAINPSHDETLARHLAECGACREEVNSFAALVQPQRALARQMTEQPDEFWRRQRESISARVGRRGFASPWKRWMWVTATVMLVWLACAVLFRNPVPTAPTATAPDPDDALLLSVQQSIQSGPPQALQPAVLLTEEIDRAAYSRRNP